MIEKLKSLVANSSVETDALIISFGLTIVLGFIISLAVHFFVEIRTGDITDYNLMFRNQLIGLALGILILEIAGIWDDIKPIRALTKLLFQIAAAAVVVGFGVRIDFITNPLIYGYIIDFKYPYMVNCL